MTLLGYSLHFENVGVTPGEELPDYLPSLLELSAAVDTGTAARILRRAAVHAHRAHVQRRPCQRARVCVLRALALFSAARQTAAAAATAGQARLPPSRETPRGGMHPGAAASPSEQLVPRVAQNSPRTTAQRARASPSAQSAARPPGDAPECPVGDGFSRGTARGRRIRGRFRHPRRVPRRPHSPDGAGRPEGDSRRREPAQGGDGAGGRTIPHLSARKHL